MENDPDVGVKWVFFSLASLLSPCVLLHDPHTHTHTLWFQVARLFYQLKNVFLYLCWKHVHTCGDVQAVV